MMCQKDQISARGELNFSQLVHTQLANHARQDAAQKRFLKYKLFVVCNSVRRPSLLAVKDFLPSLPQQSRNNGYTTAAAPHIKSILPPLTSYNNATHTHTHHETRAKWKGKEEKGCLLL